MSAPDLLAGLAEKTLLFVSGKGGVGKTTVAAALAALAARAGRSVLLVSTDGRGDAAPLFGREDRGYEEAELAPHLRTLTTDFESLLADFVGAVAPVKVLGDRLLAVPAFRFFTRATPGLPDLLLLGKVREVLKRTRGTAREPRYDLVVVDAPATGHALSLLALPRTVLRTVPTGPLRKVAKDLDALLSDPAKSALVAVAEPAELAARETEELVEGAKGGDGITTALVVVNRVGRGGKEDFLLKRAIRTPLVEVPEIQEETSEEHEEISSNGPERAGRGRRAGDVTASPSPFFETFLATFEENLRSASLSPSRSGRSKRSSRARDREPEPLSFFLPSSPRLDLGPWLEKEKLLVLTGPGGVGKTTLSAALGLAAARRGRRALVLTVDPARRLAQALGLEKTSPSGEPVAVPAAGLPRGGRLLALQIDPKATFERLLSRIASRETLARIHANRLYSGLVDSLPGVLEYMGVEALHEHAADPDVDLVVLDTPPAARGLDFLAAPRRMVELLENDALRFFLRSDGLLGKALSGASRGGAAILRAADKVLGFGFLADLADFFRAFDGLYDGFRERSAEAARLLDAARVLVASSADASALSTASDVARALAARGAKPALLLNRVDPSRERIPLPPALAALPALGLRETDTAAGDLPSALADALGR